MAKKKPKEEVVQPLVVEEVKKPDVVYIYSSYTDNTGFIRSKSDGICENTHKTSWNADSTVLMCDECVDVIKYKKKEEVKTEAQTKKEAVKARNTKQKKRKLIQIKMEL